MDEAEASEKEDERIHRLGGTHDAQEKHSPAVASFLAETDPPSPLWNA
jgi:hypothetical protein